MRRRRKILAWIGGSLLAIVVLAVVVIALFDWNRLKPFIDDKVSQALGREFVIHGDLGVAWRRESGEGWLAALLPWPEFTARDITLANPPWARAPQFARLEALRFRLSPLALLAHRVRVPHVQLVRPSVALQRDAKGRATWDFDLDHGGPPSAWSLDLGTIGFDRGTVALDDAPTGIRLDIALEPLQGPIPYDQVVAEQSGAARAQAERTAGAGAQRALARASARERIGQAAPGTTYAFRWQAGGSYRGAPANGHGRIGGVLALQDRTRPFPLQADVQLGDSHIALVGTLTDPMHLGALDVRLWFSGTSMAKLYPITGLTLPDTPPYATEGHLVAELHKHSSHYSYHDFRGRVGGSDLSGDLDYRTGGARPKLSGTVQSQLLRFADLGPLVGAGPAQADAGEPRQPPDKALPVAPFRTDRWQAMDADVQFKGAHIARGKDLPLDALGTHIVMDAGVLTLDPLRFDMAGGTVDARLRLDGSRAPMQGAVRLNARHLQLKKLFPDFEPMRTSFGEINAAAALDARGNSVAALLGSADGEAKLLLNDGAISRNLLEMAGLNVGNIVLGKLFGDRTVPIHCIASDINAKGGVFVPALFVFDTDDAVINVDGSVDLGSEQLDLTVRPHTKGFRVLSLRSPLYVRGTLKHPDVGVQVGPLLARGAGAVALGTVAAPAALLALIAPSHGKEQDACHAVLEQMRSQGGIAPVARRPLTRPAAAPAGGQR